MREKGLVKRIGITGYPLGIQREIIERTSVRIECSLSYGHLNLHDITLISSGFSDLCKKKGITLLAAAPLSMGLLTPGEPPSWHPAPTALKDRCRKANKVCQDKGLR
jgi:L-galactose dehydrogenase